MSPSLVLMTGVRVLSLGYILAEAKRKVGLLFETLSHGRKNVWDKQNVFNVFRIKICSVDRENIFTASGIFSAKEQNIFGW